MLSYELQIKAAGYHLAAANTTKREFKQHFMLLCNGGFTPITKLN